MAENIEKAAAGQAGKTVGNGTNALVTGWWAGQLFGGNRGGRGRARTGRDEPSQAHWENMDAYANREHQRRLDYLTKSHELSPEGTFASGVEYGDRGTKNAYTQRRAEAAAKADAKPAAAKSGGRSRQTAGTPPKASTGSKSRGAQVGAQLGGAIGTALGAAAVKNPAGAAVGGEVGAKLGEAAGSAVSTAATADAEVKYGT